MRKRPVNLALHTLHFPITAIVSILHRLSGLFLFLMIPLLLKAYQLLLGSAADFAQLQACFGFAGMQFLLWLLLTALVYHTLAGVRHILMDMGLFFSKFGAMNSARAVFLLALAVSACIAVRMLG